MTSLKDAKSGENNPWLETQK